MGVGWGGGREGGREGGKKGGGNYARQTDLKYFPCMFNTFHGILFDCFD